MSVLRYSISGYIIAINKHFKYMKTRNSNLPVILGLHRESEEVTDEDITLVNKTKRPFSNLFCVLISFTNWEK